MHLYFLFSSFFLLDNFVWAAPGRAALGFLFHHVAVISLLFSRSSKQCPLPQFRHSVFLFFSLLYIPMIWG